MECDCREVLYGGAAGGGKSDALLMASLQFVEVPDYAAIIFRKTYADLALPGALMDRASALLTGTGAKWNGQEKFWSFPSGATISFGYLDTENDRYRYQSSEFQCVCFDELTQFRERDYLYLFSRLRRTTDSQVPLRMRAGSNPGGSGHVWVKKRFLGDKLPADRRFISARLEDNPYLDVVAYEESLAKLDSQTRRQYRHGDWSNFDGKFYRPNEWPRYIDTGDAYRIKDGDRWRHIRKVECSRLVTLDWAMGKPKKDKANDAQEMGGDCTAFLAADMTEDGLLFMLGAFCERVPMGSNGPRLSEWCRRWLPAVVAGDDDNLSEAMLLECRRYRDIPTVRSLPLRGRNKLVRSQPAIIRAERGMVYLPDREFDWTEMYSDYLAAFSGADGETDDIADAMSNMGRLADEFVPGEDAEELDPILGAPGYDGGTWG